MWADEKCITTVPFVCRRSSNTAREVTSAEVKGCARDSPGARPQPLVLTQKRSPGEVRLWPAAVRYVHMRTICTRFADSSGHVVMIGVRNTQRGSFQSLITLLVAPRGAESGLNDEFPRVERYPACGQAIAR